MGAGVSSRSRCRRICADRPTPTFEPPGGVVGGRIVRLSGRSPPGIRRPCHAAARGAVMPTVVVRFPDRDRKIADERLPESSASTPDHQRERDPPAERRDRHRRGAGRRLGAGWNCGRTTTNQRSSAPRPSPLPPYPHTAYPSSFAGASSEKLASSPATADVTGEPNSHVRVVADLARRH
jgi:hypothetical protein